MIKTLIHNSIEIALAALRQPPRLCYARKRASSYCDGCQPGDTFQCKKCDRLMPLCLGGEDNNFDYCDGCVATFPECDRCGENIYSPALKEGYCQKCWGYYTAFEGWGLDQVKELK